jgi:hypothetical protein
VAVADTTVMEAIMVVAVDVVRAVVVDTSRFEGCERCGLFGYR